MTLPSLPTLPVPGDIIGPYTVIRELGRGGMAIVLEVEDNQSGEHLAMKLLLPGGRREILTRFEREFLALVRLDHPSVLKVHDGGRFEELPWFTMELLDGQNLLDAMEPWRALAPTERFERARHVLVEVARALAYIHDHGLVHRDVTPSNIMVLADGSIRLMDFGVVKEPGGDLTIAGEVVGTVAYIAPEQISGVSVDARADLYALGAVLYLMLTGNRPFQARTLAGYLDKHLHAAVRPPREVTPTIPEELDALCVRLLHKDPSERFASATHLLASLGEVEPQPGETGTWRAPLVGRSAERARIREAVARLALGKGGVLVLEGNQGFGKSRLVADALELARSLGIRAIEANNIAPDQRAFEGLRPVYRRLADGQEEIPIPLEAVFGGSGDSPRKRGRSVPVERWAVCAAFKQLFTGVGPVLIAE
ncbi:MAG: serine/threonine-protein kinase, partial [Myxococcota bacterium]|nr:serine/threonine-protein kinase [Myxococcota bacterium]